MATRINGLSRRTATSPLLTPPFFTPLVIASFTAIAATSTSLAANKNWNAGNGVWSVGGNWSPVGVPAFNDFVSIGNLAGVENDWVDLNVSATLSGLSITDGMTLDTNTSPLVVNGTTTISGRNETEFASYSSRLRVDQGASIFDFQTVDLTLTDEGRLDINSGATAYVADLCTINSDAVVSGYGTLRLGGDGALALKVNGWISPDIEGLTITQAGLGLIDLDGDVAGDHTLNVTLRKIDGSGAAWLTINASALADTLDEDIWLSANNVLTMNIANGWTMGSGTTLSMSGDTENPGPAQLNGSLLTMNGDITVGGATAHGQINAPIILNPTVDATVGADDRLEFNATTTIVGGTYLTSVGGDIDFDGATLVEGGFFSTVSTSAADGTIDFNGETTWDGSVTLLGHARQMGDAEVVGPTVIDAEAFDMDGGGTTSWSISNSLVINAADIDGSSGSIFDGSIALPSTLLGKLTINLDDPNDHWTMNGAMSLANVNGFTVTRVAGSSLWISGDLDVSGRVAIAAPTQFHNTNVTTFATALTTLRLGAKSLVTTGAQFVGDGALETSASGDLTLNDGVSLDAAGLKNAGVTRLGAPIGVASVDRFENTATGTLAIDIGGPLAGVDHDLLLVDNGGTTLAGSLKVNVINSGNGLFEPHNGDSFTIVAANGPITGGFTNSPVSFVPGMVYVWSVETQGSFVILSLDEAVPCAADLDGDGMVGATDLAILLGAWGRCGGCLADLNGSGAVDAADLATLLGAWGPCAY
ncbi:MAG: hypothetical protein U0572_15055 [Phycisphaerales bacterium]